MGLADYLFPDTGLNFCRADCLSDLINQDLGSSSLKGSRPPFIGSMTTGVGRPAFPATKSTSSGEKAWMWTDGISHVPPSHELKDMSQG